MRIHVVAGSIALVAAVSLLGCAGLGSDKETEQASGTQKKSAGSKSVTRDAVIVPGKRIGPVSLGMPVSQLYDVMGEPTQSVRGPGNERYVFDDLQVTVDDAGESVQTIATESEDYATSEGIKVGLTDLAIKAKLTKRSGQLLIREEGDTTVYFTPGMVVTTSGGTVKSIAIRPAGGG